MLVGGKPRNHALLCISLASLGWAFSFGLSTPLASLWLQAAGCSGWAIGLNTACYYLGVVLSAPFVPLLMGRANRLCVGVGMLLDAVGIACFPLVSSELAWHGLRWLCGVGTSLSLIPMETLVNHNALREHRARDFGFYAFCVALGIGLGSVVGLASSAAWPKLTFTLGGLVTILAIPLAWRPMPGSLQAEESSHSQAFPWRNEVLSLGTAWAQGFLEGGTLTFLSLYLLTLGYQEGGISLLLGALFAGVVVAQLPLAWLADRLGRQKILLLCHILLLTGLALTPFLHSMYLLGGMLFVLGACCGALYPLGLSFLGERVPTDSMARANAWYLTSNCLGSLSGPLVIGLLIDLFGIRAQFVAGGLAILMVLLADRWWRAPLSPPLSLRLHSRLESMRRAA